MQLNFPELSTIKLATVIIENLISAQKSDAPLTFDFSKLKWIDPFAISIISGTIMSCLKMKNREVTYVPPEDKKIKKYLSQIGFNSFFQLNGDDIHKSTSVELSQLTALNPLHIESLITLIDSQMRLSKGMKDSLKMSIQEVLTNVFDHSKSKIGCFVCAQYYPAKMTIRLCITDFGIGILSSLKAKYNISDDINAIKLSVKEGVTSRSQSAGFGLTHIRNFLKVNKGILTIISGRGEVRFYNKNIKSHNMKNGFDGTIVNLKINADKESFYFMTEEQEYIF